MVSLFPCVFHYPNVSIVICHGILLTAAICTIRHKYDQQEKEIIKRKSSCWCEFSWVMEATDDVRFFFLDNFVFFCSPVGCICSRKISRPKWRRTAAVDNPRLATLTKPIINATTPDLIRQRIIIDIHPPQTVSTMASTINTPSWRWQLTVSSPFLFFLLRSWADTGVAYNSLFGHEWKNSNRNSFLNVSSYSWRIKLGHR